MFESFHFQPLIDLPLGLATLCGFLFNFPRYARTAELDTTVDLGERLPAARLRITVLMVVLVAACWISNIAFWAVMLSAVIAGLVLSLLLGGADALGLAVIVAAAWLAREWAFGFPQLILHTPRADRAPIRSDCTMSGKQGRTLSPLRPCGEADVDLYGDLCRRFPDR